MNYLYKILLLFICYSITACEPEYAHLQTPPFCWEKFVGTYNVSDTANNSTYIMTITHFATQNINGGYEDTLIITNFANKFNFRYHFSCFSDPNIFRIIAPFPCYDHDHKRWSLSANSDDISTLVIENQLKDDKLILYFNMDNIAFYTPDGVPYHSADHKHIAIKQH